MLSETCKYALLAMMYLARQEDRRFIPVRHIGEALCIPTPYLAKVFQLLMQEGLVEGVRGRRGGVRLARRPSEITLMDIVRAIDGERIFTECVLGLPECGDEKPCPVHDYWTIHRAGIRSLFETYTLERLQRGYPASLYRLTLCGDGSR